MFISFYCMSFITPVTFSNCCECIFLPEINKVCIHPSPAALQTPTRPGHSPAPPELFQRRRACRPASWSSRWWWRTGSRWCLCQRWPCWASRGRGASAWSSHRGNGLHRCSCLVWKEQIHWFSFEAQYRHSCWLQVPSYLQFHLPWWSLLPGSWTVWWLGGICFLCSQILSVQYNNTQNSSN